MTLVFLPGLDGTGDLFAPLLRVLAPTIEYQVLSYANDDLDFSQLADKFAAQIEGENIVLVAESFSGKAAYLLRQQNANIKHVIFIASFISKPSIISSFARFVPVELLKSKHIPHSLLSILLFNSPHCKILVEHVRTSVNKVDNEVLKNRLALMTTMSMPKDHIGVSATYIRPSNDVLVNATCIEAIKRVFSEVKVHTVTGGHFIAQINPEKCNEVIQQTVQQAIGKVCAK